MTIAASTRYTTYSPVVATTAFAVGFPIFDNTDLQLLHNGVAVSFTVTATYVDGVSTNAVVNAASPGLTGSVIVVGARATRRTDQYLNGAPLPIRDHNYSLNRLTAEVQETRRDIDRAVKAAVGTAGPALPTKVSGKLIGWNDTGLENKDLAGTSLIALPSGLSADAGKDLIVGLLGTPYIIHEPTFLNPTRRWAIDGTGSAGDLAAHQAAINWAVTNGRSLEYPKGDFLFPDQLAHLSSGNLIQTVNGVATVSPGNGLRIFGNGRDDDTVFKMTAAMPNSKALLKVDGNMNSYASSAANGGNPVGQGKNIIAGISFHGRGQASGVDNRAVDIRANWDLLMQDFKCVGFSGDMIKMFSAASLGNDDVDSNARIVFDRFSLLGGGKAGILATDARIAQLHVSNFEIRGFNDSGAKVSAIYSSFAHGFFAACGSVVGEGGLHVVDSGTQAFSRSIDLDTVQFENNYGFEAYIEHCRSAKLNNCHVAPYQPVGAGVLTKSGIQIGARAKNWEVNHLTGSNYSNTEGYKIPYIRVLDGAEAGIIDSPKVSNADTHIIVGIVNGLELRNIPPLVDIDYAATSGSWPGVQAQNPIDISIAATATDVVWNGQVCKNGPRYPAARINLAAGADLANVTGDATVARTGVLSGLATITESYDYGSNLASGVFTCPQAGWYIVKGLCRLTGFAAASHTEADLLLVINGAVTQFLAQTEDLTQYTLAATTIVTLQGSVTVYCAKNDTIEIGPRVQGGGAGKTIDLVRAVAPDTFFMEVRKV